MSSPGKQKGTRGETEVKRAFEQAGFLDVERTAPTLPYDIRVNGRHIRSVDVLATRPDQGFWLVTIDLNDFLDLLGYRGYGAHVEVKRFKRFAHHSIFEQKFGGEKVV